MRPGEVIEAAIWLSGKETKAMRDRYEHEVRENIREACFNAGVLYGAVTFTEKRIGEDRVPTPPDHVQGPDVRLLVAETPITGFALQPPGFTSELDRSDLLKLREVVRNKHALLRGGSLTDMECDDLINDIGPEAAVDKLRRG